MLSGFALQAGAGRYFGPPARAADACGKQRGSTMDMLLEAAFWAALGQIIMVNIVLSGDNAVVIALACRNLPDKYRNPAVMAGSAGAIILRIIFCIIVAWLLEVPYLKIVGGALLLWIGVKLLLQDEEEGGHGKVEGSASLWGAIWTIVVADAVMSLDNAIAIAAAAKQAAGEDPTRLWTLLIIGLLISIPIIVFGSTLLMKVMSRYPIIISIGGALLGWVAGEMLATDFAIKHWVEASVPHAHYVFAAAGAGLVVALGAILSRRRQEAHPAVDLAETDRK
jgi:YjbE family integral membrane protein